jgi:hypothetical protein
MHVPPVHVSARAESHVMQVPPTGPQVDGEMVWHWLPEQHPEHDVELHTHVPLASSHICSASHCGPLPHRHWPATHPVVRSGSHATQLDPPTPHVAFDDVSHRPVIEQHPLGHDVPSHTHMPSRQRCPTAHAAPVVPH